MGPGTMVLHHALVPAILDHSRTLPQGDRRARPALAGGEVGGERNLVVLDAGDVLHDAFAVLPLPKIRFPRIARHADAHTWDRWNSASSRWDERRGGDEEIYLWGRWH